MYGINPISPNEERAKILILFFRLCIAMLGLSAVLEFITAATFDGSLDLVDTRIIVLSGTLVSVFRLIIFVLVAIFFIMWMRRAYHNLHKSGLRNLRHSEGWASGAWFVPFVNLGRPLLIMREIWNDTQNVFRRQGEDFQREEDNITGSWWALWLISNFVTQTGSYLLKDREFEAGYVCGAIGSIGYILCGFLAVNMIKRISRMESEMMDRSNQYYAWVVQQQAADFQRQQNVNSEDVQQDQNVLYPENLQQPYSPQNNSQDNLLSVIQEVAQLDNGIMNRSKEYYAWVTQQQAEQEQQQQNAHPENPIRPNPEEK